MGTGLIQPNVCWAVNGWPVGVGGWAVGVGGWAVGGWAVGTVQSVPFSANLCSSQRSLMLPVALADELRDATVVPAAEVNCSLVHSMCHMHIRLGRQ